MPSFASTFFQQLQPKLLMITFQTTQNTQPRRCTKIEQKSIKKRFPVTLPFAWNFCLGKFLRKFLLFCYCVLWSNKCSGRMGNFQGGLYFTVFGWFLFGKFQKVNCSLELERFEKEWIMLIFCFGIIIFAMVKFFSCAKFKLVE